LKVVYIYRQFRLGVFSIEELFHAIAAEQRKAIEVIEYETGPRVSILKDLWFLWRMNADVYHVTGDINYIVLLLPWRKTVLTVTDIGNFLFGLRGIKRWIYKMLWLRWPMSIARAVTSISKATEDNVVEHLGVDRSRVITIDCCYSPLFQYVPHSFNREYPTVLQVGTKPYKNVPRIIDALRGIKCRLVLIGQLDEPIRKQLDECGIDYENRVNLTHQQVFQAYVDCDIVTFVSIGEGFGVPIIEAQAAGRPLITANIPPMNEVAGNGACKVSPLDISEIREGIQRIIRDEEYRNQIVESGLKNATNFSPQAIAAQYRALYKRMSTL
jgi:glycosyltransferase involved in cell wall biosynthesis